MKIRFIVIFDLVLLILLGWFVWQQQAHNQEQSTSSSVVQDVSVNDTVPSDLSSDLMESDFTPSQGSTTGPASRGPWSMRLILATSSDGQTFTSTGMVLTDQGDVPDLAMDKEGTLYLYYTAWTAGTVQNVTVVALSKDQGQTWVYKYLDLNDLQQDKMPAFVDPDIQILEDGTFRLYMTSAAKTHYFESVDGITFDYKGVAFEQDGKLVLDPNTIKVGDEWHFFAGGDKDNWHAISSDGKEFTFYENQEFVGTDGKSYMMANGLAVDGGYRYFGFSNNGVDIQSFFSTDGYTWTPEGVALAYDADSSVEEEQVKDSSVIQLLDGTYLMVYVTKVPE